MKRWWKEAVVYQIYPRSFRDSNGDGIGDLKGIIEKLDYIHDLGVNVVWLNPIYSSPNDDNGYDISDYETIMDEFGTMEDFDLLLEEMHKRGIKLIMDLVVNHTSDEHKWFVESRKGTDNPYRDYYIWKDGKKAVKNQEAKMTEPTNWGSIFSGSAWEQVEEQYYLHCFTKKQPDLNWENPQVREEVYKMMHFWLRKGVDGFRMDVINALAKPELYVDAEVSGNSAHGDIVSVVWNNDKVHDYLKEMNEEVLSHYDIMTVGETSKVTPEIADLYVREDRKELNMVFQFEHMSLDTDWCKWVEREWKLTELKEILSKWQTELHVDSWNSLYWNNHDQARVVSRFGNDKEYRKESAKMLATLLHMMRGTPYVYQGEEIGMTNITLDHISDFDDIEIRNGYRQYVETGLITEEQFIKNANKFGRDNSRTPMQWDESQNGGFSDGEPWIKVNPNYKRINAEESIKNHDSIYHYYKQLIQLRKDHEIIVYGDYELLLPDHESLFVYKRTYENQGLLVISNYSEEEEVYSIPDAVIKGNYEVLIRNYNTHISDAAATGEKDKLEKTLALKPYESIVIRYVL